MPSGWKIVFREFLDALHVPAYLFDPEMKRFVAANCSFCELVGYPEPELTALEWPLIMADQAEAVRANQEIAGRQEDAFMVNDFAFRRKNGARVDTRMEYRVMHVVDDHGVSHQIYFSAVVSASPKNVHRVNVASS
jgi:PAS domain S-box-containing protein